MKRLVHLSDIHFGRVDPLTVEPIISAVRTVEPNVVIVSGDLTQRAREHQFEAARQFLDRLPGPQIVVPGNHDVPLINAWARLMAPLTNYRKIIDKDVEPCYRDDELMIVGVNTARSLTWKNGRISAEQVERVRELICGLAPEVLRIVVMHHPIDLPREFPMKQLVEGAEEAVPALAACGVDVFLSGHYHLGHTGDTSTRYDIPGFNALIVHAGTATSTRGRGQPNSFNAITVDYPRLVVDRYHWRAEARVFEVFSSEHFERGSEGWERKKDDTAEAPDVIAVDR